MKCNFCQKVIGQEYLAIMRYTKHMEDTRYFCSGICARQQLTEDIMDEKDYHHD